MSGAPQVFGQPAVVQGQFGNNAGGNRKEVAAYINISLPRTDGKDGKIDRGLRLYADDAASVELAQFLQSPEGIEWFKANAVVTCNILGEKAGFAIPGAK
jgi:hypothetical protein